MPIGDRFRRAAASSERDARSASCRARPSRHGDVVDAREGCARRLSRARAETDDDENRVVMTAATRRSAAPPSAAETTTTTRADVDKMTVATLRDELRARGLATDGLKAALATRLREALDSPTRGTKRDRVDGEGAPAPAVEARETKRRRWDDGENGGAPVEEAKAPAAASVKGKVGGLDKAALLKQKQALLKQKELAAKLKARKEASEKSKAEEKSSARPSAKQMTLRLDAQGREIDESGALVVNKVIETSTLRMNLKQQRANAFAQAQAEAQAELASQMGAEYDDPSLRGGRARKPRTNFQFVEDGKYQKEADMHRLRLQFGDEKAEKMKSRAERERKHAAHMEKLEKEAAMDPNLVPVGERPSAARGASAARPIAPLDEIPEVEWWDKDFLQNGTYDDVTNGNWHVNMDKFNVYVEHPVPIQPPLDAPAPAPQPLMLTKAEQKKLRTQRRVAREKEKQEMIKQGLIEPPKPKVKISNLMRVLKDEAVLDPTAIEREVREQMAEREQAHQDRNLARMLTPAERREKRMRKLLGSDATGEVHTHVYRVEDMSNRKNRFKVDINAQENHLTGVGLITDDFSVVVVEGTSKAIRRYDKLMMRRIDWNASLNEHDDMEVDEDKKNKCTRVWKGTSTSHALKRFTFETLRSEAAARRYLTEVKLEHLWDAAFACKAVEDEND